MVKGLYTAYTGMINQQNRMDILTNNLANSATNGFKKEGWGTFLWALRLESVTRIMVRVPSV